MDLVMDGKVDRDEGDGRDISNEITNRNETLGCPPRIPVILPLY